MTNDNAPKLVMKIESGAPVYVFTLQARKATASPPTGFAADRETQPDGDDINPSDGALELAQIEAARNAAVAALNANAVEVDSTSSVLAIDPLSEPSRIVLTADIQPLSTIGRPRPENDAANVEPTSENENQEP